MYKICLRIPIDFPKKETARNTNNIDDLGGFDFTQLIDYKSLSYPYSVSTDDMIGQDRVAEDGELVFSHPRDRQFVACIDAAEADGPLMRCGLTGHKRLQVGRYHNVQEHPRFNNLPKDLLTTQMMS